jgi:hypothetical protein
MKFYGGTVTGSLTVNGTQTINGTLTAQTLVVQTITSSISRITGSTQFGQLASNTHQFTGSMYVTGSITANKVILSGGADQSELTNAINNDFKLTNSGNFRIVNNANTVALFSITNAGQILIGTATAIFNSQVNINYNQSTYEGLAISTDKIYNGSPQPNLIFGGKYNSAGDYRQFATIQAIKDNATSGDSAASLAFYTNGNSASVTERMRISSTGTTTFYGTIAQSGTPCQILQTVSNSIPGDNSVVIYNTSSTGYGMYIAAGSATTNALYITNYSRATALLTVRGDGMVTTPAQPAFYAYLPGGATTSTTGNYAGFNTTRLNRGSHYSTSTGRFTAPIAGVYRFLFAALYRRQGGASAGEISISINGTNVNTRGLVYVVNNITDGHSPVVAELIISLSASDYVMPFIYAVGAGSDFYVGENLAYFCGYLIG